jgi:hypothetical protein
MSVQCICTPLDRDVAIDAPNPRWMGNEARQRFGLGVATLPNHCVCRSAKLSVGDGLSSSTLAVLELCVRRRALAANEFADKSRLCRYGVQPTPQISKHSHSAFLSLFRPHAPTARSYLPSHHSSIVDMLASNLIVRSQIRPGSSIRLCVTGATFANTLGRLSKIKMAVWRGR